MVIDVKDLKPVTTRKIVNCDNDVNETIQDGYEWDGIFIPKESSALAEWFLNNLRKYNKIENYSEILPRKADNLRIELRSHDPIMNDDYFNIVEDNNPENTAIRLYTYRVTVAFEHDDEGNSFPVITHDNQGRHYESNEKAVEDIERWISARLGRYTPKVTYFISRKDNGFEKRGILTR